jgi:hypothetical protein
MEAPSWVLERLHAYDARLFIRWNGKICRWEIWRKGPTESAPATLVKVWCRYDKDVATGIYLPLDNRLFAWLAESDMRRKFRDRDRKFWARLHMQELDEKNRLADLEAQKQAYEDRGELREGLAFALRKDLRIGTPVPRTAFGRKKVTA